MMPGGCISDKSTLELVLEASDMMKHRSIVCGGSFLTAWEERCVLLKVDISVKVRWMWSRYRHLVGLEAL